MKKHNLAIRTFSYVSILLLCLSLMGCKSAHLMTSGPINQKLPLMNPIIDQNSLERTFGLLSYVSSTSRTYGTYGYGGFYSTTYGGKPHIERNASADIVSDYCLSEISENICESTGRYKGKIVIKVLRGYDYTKKGLRAPSIIFGFCTLNLFGFPFGKTKGGLQLQMEIYNSYGDRIAIYESGYHRHKEMIAMYWGYDEISGERQCLYDAVKECMDDFKDQISKDRYDIIRKL